MLPVSLLVLLLSLVRSTSQITYSCDPSAPCGCSVSPASVAKIVGGENAVVNTWGWAVSLSISRRWLCGGSILSSSWVLTAAHCVLNARPTAVFVSAGTTELYGAEQWRFGSAIIVHPEYDDYLIQNDIALVKVWPPFNMTDRSIAQICLPSEVTVDYPPVGPSLVAIGWGKLSQNGSVSETLQQVTLQRTQYESNRCWPIISNASVQFCAGVSSGNKDTCNGDSGGPLMLFTPTKQWVVVGLTSYGYLCANPYVSGVFTRVSYYIDWIYSMNVTGVLTANLLTTTVSYFNTSIAAMTRSNATNDGLSRHQDFYLRFILTTVMILFSIFIVFSLD